jgi:hypothetical protein
MRPDGIAVLPQRSILNVTKEIRPSGSFLDVDSSRGAMYFSYGLYRENYVSNGETPRGVKEAPAGHPEGSKDKAL